MFYKRAWVLPISKSGAFLPRDASQIDNKAEDDQEYDQKNFQTSKEEFNPERKSVNAHLDIKRSCPKKFPAPKLHYA
jgi:hypothetical protein